MSSVTSVRIISHDDLLRMNTTHEPLFIIKTCILDVSSLKISESLSILFEREREGTEKKEG